jgi:hypothetical protein
MVKGLTQTSSVVAIGFSLDESAASTFTQGSVDLNLSPLDREVFVVLAINLDVCNPDALAGTNTKTHSQVTTTSQTGTVGLANANCLATATNAIRAQGMLDSGVGFQTMGMETPPATLDFIGIIATNDFFVGVQGSGNLTAKCVEGKMYGYRARAAGEIYAALVQSEVLSA